MAATASLVSWRALWVSRAIEFLWVSQACLVLMGRDNLKSVGVREGSSCQIQARRRALHSTCAAAPACTTAGKRETHAAAVAIGSVNSICLLPMTMCWRLIH